MQDLTKITTPWGLLDEETKAALRAYKGPIEVYTGDWCLINSPKFNDPSIAYRAKPQPVRGEVVKYGCVNGMFSTTLFNYTAHRLTLPTIDGALIAGEYRDDAGNVIKLEVL